MGLRNTVAFTVLAMAVCAWGQEKFVVKSGQDKFAKIVYPAQGNILLEEGTFEGWFQIGFDPQRSVTEPRWFSPMTYVFVGTPGKSSVFSLISQYSYNEMLKEGAGSLRFHGKMQAKGSFDVPYAELKWAKGQWHALAVTWKKTGARYLCRIFVDGAPKAQQETELAEQFSLGESDVIQIGAHFLNSCYAAVDAIRVSSVERTDEEIRQSAVEGPAWDRYTLLLDDFESIDERVPKNVFTIAEKGQKGTISGACRIVDGPHGKALKLHVVEE